MYTKPEGKIPKREGGWEGRKETRRGWMEEVGMREVKSRTPEVHKLTERPARGSGEVFSEPEFTTSVPTMQRTKERQLIRMSYKFHSIPNL